MDLTALLIGIGIGAALASIIVWLVSKAGSQRLATLVEQGQISLRKAEADAAVNNDKIEKLQEQVLQLNSESARLQSEVDARARAYEDAKAQLGESFKATAAQVLEGQRETFFDLAKTKLEGIAKLSEAELEKRQQAIDSLVKPVGEKLKSLDDHISAMERLREGAYKELRAQVEVLRSTNQLLQRDTANLTQALKGSSQRGRWGEIQLRRIIEIAEMSPHCDFVEQSHSEGEEGRQRPDVVVRMPERGSIIIDSKVPDNLWFEAEAEADSDVRQAKMKDFARQVRAAVNSLGQKAYRAQADSVEFVVMFMPGEHYLGDALRADPGLLEFGFERRVVLATPTTLLSLLRTVFMGWQNAKMAESAKEIAEEGKKLHRHIAVFAEHFEDVKKHFNKAEDALNKAEKTANRGVFSTAKRLEKLAAKSDKSLPPSALANMEDLDTTDEPMPIASDSETAADSPAGLFLEEEPVS